MKKFEDLVGQVLVSVVNKDNDEIIFNMLDGSTARLYHSRDCCESVTVEDVIGNLDDLVGRVLFAYEETSGVDPEDKKKSRSDYESFTWTFYRIATAKGTVVIRFYGESNGYYSESVSFKHSK